MAWIYEEPLPFTITGVVYFSPIVDDVVYIIDRGTNFWKYNLATKIYSVLTSPSASNADYRSLALSPDGTKLATTTSYNLINIYTIATNAWADSATAPQIVTTNVRLKSLVWEDNDIIWAWAAKGTQLTGKCFKYVSSTNTWSQFTNLTGVQDTWLARGAAIKADGSVVYGSSIGDVPNDGLTYFKYTVATDTYTKSASVGSARNAASVADRGKLWHFDTAAYRQHYVDVADDSITNNVYVENTDRSGGYHNTYGISDDLGSIISEAKSTAPELMSFTAVTFIPRIMMF